MTILWTQNVIRLQLFKQVTRKSKANSDNIELMRTIIFAKLNLKKKRSEKDVSRTVLFFLNPLSSNFTKWSNTLKQIVDKLPTNCLSVFDHFVRLALKGLKSWLCLLKCLQAGNALGFLIFCLWLLSLLLNGASDLPTYWIFKI